MDGLLLIHKPEGLTSHDVVRRVRRLCKTKKVGHAGTLDPMATGVLLIAVNEGTKVLQFLLQADKAYKARVALGAITDTQDREGAVLETRPVAGITCDRVRQEIAALTGEIEQLPPMYSALKKDGVPLYKLARQGVEVERKARQVNIQRFQMLSCSLPETAEVEVAVDCSTGTYIRTLGHDLGQRLGCGAHLAALERTRVGSFKLEDCITLEQLEAEAEAGRLPIRSPDQALQEHPGIDLDEEAYRRLLHGIAPSFSEVKGEGQMPEGVTCRLRFGERLIAMARVRKNRGGKQRGDFELLRVFNSP